MDLDDLLKLIVARGASDLHLSAGSVPHVRVDGQLVALTDYPVLSAPDTRRLAIDLLSAPEQSRILDQQGDLDFSFAVAGLSRFRCAIYTQRGALSLVIRPVPFTIPAFEELGLPEPLRDLAAQPRGLVLVTGPPGSGKSTTLAALVDLINQTTAKHIVTIEAAIEFIHRHRQSLVDQREVGSDTPSVGRALEAVVRHDPDVIVIGDLRGLETLRAAFRLADTGHLVLGALATPTAAQTILEIIDLFPVEQQKQARLELARVLEGIVSQVLVPRVGGGRALAVELVLAAPAIRTLIREDRLPQLEATIQASQAQGMRILNQSLAELVRRGEIAREDAFAGSPAPEELAVLL